MIVGVGIELVDTGRFAAAIERFGDRLGERLFTREERAYAMSASRRPGPIAQSLAVRFAAKLAARRALGAKALHWQEVEVIRREQGAPTLLLHGAAERLARTAGVDHIALTLSHDAHWSIGQVILESGAWV